MWRKYCCWPPAPRDSDGIPLKWNPSFNITQFFICVFQVYLCVDISWGHNILVSETNLRLQISAEVPAPPTTFESFSVSEHKNVGPIDGTSACNLERTHTRKK